jgi:hypothetical protein
MQQFSADDTQFFSDPLNWRYGPMYDTCLYFQRGTNLADIEPVIFEAGRQWQGAGPELLKSILHIEGLPSVGLVHSKRSERLIAGSKNKYTFPSYCVAIYPPHYERALGLGICAYGTDQETWDKMDPMKVRLFHEALFQLIRGVHRHHPILSVSINTEDRGMALPYTRDGSICISPNLPPILGVKANSLSNACGYFVSIEGLL